MGLSLNTEIRCLETIAIENFLNFKYQIWKI